MPILAINLPWYGLSMKLLQTSLAKKKVSRLKNNLKRLPERWLRRGKK